MAIDLTFYINNAKAKLGNAAVVHRTGNTTYRVKNTTVEEWFAPTVQSLPLGTQLDEATYYNQQKLKTTHNINAVPDTVAEDLKLWIDLKLRNL